MSKLRSSSTMRRQGFTLVEMLLVLVILATLAAIVVPKLSGIGQDSKVKAVHAQIAVFEQAMERYELANGSYPPGNSGLQALVEAPGNAPKWNGPYLSKTVIPNDPWGQPYVYAFPGKINPSGYDIISGGPNGRVGDDDDIDNSGRAAK